MAFAPVRSCNQLLNAKLVEHNAMGSRAPGRSESPLLSLPAHLWDVVYQQLDQRADRIALCLATRDFFAQWSSQLLKSLQGCNVMLPAGRFLRRVDGVQDAVHLEFQIPCRAATADVLLLTKFLQLASPESSKSLSTTFECLRNTENMAVFLRCPSQFKAAPQLCAGHLPASPRKGEKRQICILVSTDDTYLFQPTDLRLRLSGNKVHGTADAHFELRAAQPVFDGKRDPVFDTL